MTETNCIFCRIAKGEIPARLVRDQPDLIAFHDIDPRAPVHVLIVTRRHISSIAGMKDEDAGVIGKLFSTARDVAVELGVAETGYRLVINNGADAGQTVDHVHLHVLGGRQLKWPPG